MTDKKLPQGNFERFIGTVYEPFILPILPHGAPLKPRESDGKTVDPQNCGKIPGRYLGAAGWVGMKGWQTYSAKDRDLRRWQHWHTPELANIPVPTGLRLNEFPAIDGDINRADDAAEIRGLVQMHFGETAVRTRPNSPRFTLYFRWVGGTQLVTKRTVAWFDDKGEKHAIDILGVGCQSVIEGMHKSGVAYEWLEGDLLDWAGKLPEVDAVSMSKFLRGVHDWIEHKGYTPSKPQIGDMTGGYDEADLIPIGMGDILSPLAVTEEELPRVTRCLQSINLDDPRCDYDVFIDLIRAAKAVCDGSQDYLINVVHPWVCTQTIAHGAGPLTKDREDSGLPWLQDRWNSFPSSRHGAEYLYNMAASRGHKEAQEAQAEIEADHAQEIFKPHGDTNPGTDQISAGGADAAGAPGQADGSSGAGSGGNGTPSVPASAGGSGGGPTPYSDTHWALANTFAAQHGAHWRFNTDVRRWLHYENGIWRFNDNVTHAIGEMTYAESQRILGGNGANAAQRSRALEGAGTITAVRNLLQGHTAMTVTNDEFDLNSHLLNSPDGVIDLRSGDINPHAPEYMMRQMTACGPDYNLAYSGEYEAAAPRFFHTLRNIAAGREWVIPALQACFGMVLSGEIRHHSLLFIQGLPGIGKTQVLQVLFDIMHLYGGLLGDAFLSKNGGEAKRFDMADIIGKRMLFLDEVQLGMSWDGTRASNVVSGRVLSAELKFGRRVEFRNTATICISGNHRPHFVSGEAGGLTSRMLLLEAKGANLRGSTMDITNVATQIVAEEGPAILMWALMGSIEDYNSQGNVYYNSRVREMREAAVAYTRENSVYVQWVELEGLVLEPDAWMNTVGNKDRGEHGAYTMFCDHARERGERGRIRLDTFKQGMLAAYPNISFGKDTRDFRANKATVFGLGLPKTVDASGNVVVFPPASPRARHEAGE